MKSIILFASIALLPMAVEAQTSGETEAKPLITATPLGKAKKSSLMISPCRGEVRMRPFNATFQARLVPPSSSPNEAENVAELDSIKLAKYRLKLAADTIFAPNEESAGTLPRSGIPAVGTNFQGNFDNGCPPDNSLAISNAGYIVSCVNSNIVVYNTGGWVQSSMTLYDFFANLWPSPDLCDPKVIYDGQADRFILYTQVCNGQPADDQVLLAFSKTNNPAGSWWVYALTGNPLGDFSWFDYPKTGISNNEFYLCGNLYQDNSYNQSVLYQIPKQAGYNGQSLNWQYWYDIDGQPFTLLPLSRGQSGSYGPGTYLVSTLSGGGNYLKFYDLTDYMSASNEELVYYQVSVSPYSVPPAAGQSGTWYALDAGDCRTMDGFYLNGVAHVVFTEDNNNWASIRYTRITVNNLTSQFAQATFPNEKDYAYPSVASFSKNQNDQSAIVGFLASGNNYYPEMRLKYYDNNMGTVASIPVQQGNGYQSSCYNPERQLCRWGDYSGLARRHSAQSPNVWMSGCFGDWSGYWQSWVAEIYDTGVSDAAETETAKNELRVAPNPAPAAASIKVSIVVDATENVRFQVFDAAGALIDELHEGYLLPGENRFSFSSHSLAPGVYFLRAVSSVSQKLIANEKFVVAP